jgi:hypothetical protein
MGHWRRFRPLYLLLAFFGAPTFALWLLTRGLVPGPPVRPELVSPDSIFFYVVVAALLALLTPGLIFLLLAAPVAIHEIGHAIAAVAVRWRVLAFAVGPLLFYRRREGIATAFLPGWLELQGWIFADPIGPYRWRREAIIFGAGPLASGLGGLLILTGNSFLGAVGTMSLFGLLNLLPFKQGVPSDGLRLLQLFRQKSGAPPPSDWIDLFDTEEPVERMPLAFFIAQALMSEGTHREPRAYLYAYYIALLKGREGLARRLIAKAAAAAGETDFERVFEEYAYAMAAVDPDAARSAFARSRAAGSPARLRAQAALSLAEGDQEGAAVLHQEALDAFDRTFFPPGLQSVETWMLDDLSRRLSHPTRRQR